MRTKETLAAIAVPTKSDLRVEFLYSILYARCMRTSLIVATSWIPIRSIGGADEDLSRDVDMFHTLPEDCPQRRSRYRTYGEYFEYEHWHHSLGAFKEGWYVRVWISAVVQ